MDHLSFSTPEKPGLNGERRKQKLELRYQNEQNAEPRPAPIRVKLGAYSEGISATYQVPTERRRLFGFGMPAYLSGLMGPVSAFLSVYADTMDYTGLDRNRVLKLGVCSLLVWSSRSRLHKPC